MKRGSSALSLIVGIDKPVGMSSHDVVNRCRRIFFEKRVGHAGTLDPLASGALLVCVGPATRLSSFFTEHDKQYRFSVAFGSATDTDDSEGRVIMTGSIPEEVRDPAFAEGFVSRLAGPQRQIPPVYSAVKVQGKRSYRAAREGTAIDLAPRDIEVFDARLLRVEGLSAGESPVWHIEVRVSKGTYVRALARDIGNMLACPAHVSSLRRTKAGLLSLEECVTLESLEEMKAGAALDPVALLGYRVIFVRDEEQSIVANGGMLPIGERKAFTCPRLPSESTMCSCTSTIRESAEAFSPEEPVAVVAENRLVGLYRYDRNAQALKPQCVFPVGVARGNDSKG